MILEGVPGINVYFDFSANFSQTNLVKSGDLFKNPDRSKYGFYWKIDSNIIKETSKYRSFNTIFSGFYIESYEEAGVAMGFFNRVFYNTFLKNFNHWEAQEKKNSFKIQIDTDEMNKVRWEAFYSHLREVFSTYHVPFRKFLASKRPDKCWISFSDSDVAPQDPIYLDFLCGVPSLEFKYPGFKIEFNEWINAIKDGPLGNPEIPIVEKFFHYFPGSIKFAPPEISEKFEVDYLGDLSDFGII